MFKVAHSLGEEGLSQIYDYVKMMLNVLHDNNYKLRRDGVLFLKDYLSSDQVSMIINGARYKETYLPELLDLVYDEDIHI